jgi:hypothetical protein
MRGDLDEVLPKSSNGYPLRVGGGEHGKWLLRSVHLRAFSVVEVLTQPVLVAHGYVVEATVERRLLPTVLPLAPRQRLRPAPHEVALDDAGLHLRLREVRCDVRLPVPVEDAFPHVLEAVLAVVINLKKCARSLREFARKAEHCGAGLRKP